MILGLTLGQEVVTGPILIALPLILAGVGLVATAKDRKTKRPSPQPRPATEPIRETAA